MTRDGGFSTPPRLWEIKANFDAYKRWLIEGDRVPIVDDDVTGYWLELAADPHVTKKELRKAVTFLAMCDYTERSAAGAEREGRNE